MASIFWRTEDKRARTRRERERGEKRKEKRKKEPLWFSPFLFSGFVRASRHGERLSLLFFFFSLSHCETPQLGCRSRVSSLLLYLEISPDEATRQLPSPNLKEITPNAASCRCGRGEKRTKEDALLGASGDTTSLVRFLRRQDFKRKKNKTLACALVAEQSRTIPASSGSTAALDCMAEGLKKISQRGERGEKKKRTKKVWRMCSQLFNVLFRNLLRPLPLPLPCSPFLGQPTSELPSLLPLL